MQHSLVIVVVVVPRLQLAHLARGVVHHLPRAGVACRALGELGQAARAVGADARALGLQRQLAHEPVLVAVHENGAPVVELHLVRAGGAGGGGGTQWRAEGDAGGRGGEGRMPTWYGTTPRSFSLPSTSPST
jgi:hypothetical protein